MDAKTQHMMSSLFMSVMANLSEEEKRELTTGLSGKELIEQADKNWQGVISEHCNRETSVEKSYENCNINSEFYNATFDDYKPFNDSQRQALDAVKELVEKKTGKVILLGGNGLGKTFLGTIAVKMLGGKIYTMFEISCLIRQAYSNLARKTELEILQELSTLPILCIDEIGRSKSSDTERNWLSYIIDNRHTRRLPTMILGNVHLMKHCTSHGCPYCFERFFGRDVLSRFKENTRLITLTGDDYRGRKQEGKTKVQVNS